MAIQFRGNIPEGYEVNHKEDDKHSNHPDNLEIITKSQNARHSVRVLGKNRGTDHGRAPFSEDDIRDIRRRVAAGELRKDLAEEYETHPSNITHIAECRTWKHVE